MEKRILKSVYFKKLKGLHDIKIEFSETLTAIMGVNGIGKTTVIHALACIYQPDGNGENHKFPEFFVPNTDATWTGSELTVTNTVLLDKKQQGSLDEEEYKKNDDRWAPRYTSRPKRNVYYIGIDTCLPEIEKKTPMSRIAKNNELKNAACAINAVKDSHEWLDDIKNRLGYSESDIVNEIFKNGYEDEELANYILEIKDWLLKKVID